MSAARGATLDIQDEVATALEHGNAVVAMETTVIAHGLPRPINLETAQAAEAAVRAAGAVPATIGILDGRVKIGLGEADLNRFAEAADDGDGDGGESDIEKASSRDVAALLAGGRSGATTVAGTVALAALAGIPVMATGGIGGVHRGGEESLDISADLRALAQFPVAVVSAGAKAILDLPRTMEVLESLGVPVIGLGTDRFPGFYLRDSGLPVPASLPDAASAARALQAHWGLGLSGGLLIANPPPVTAALQASQVESWIIQAEAQARQRNVGGKELTPFLLQRLGELSHGRTLETNPALLIDNARVAGELAVAYADLIDDD